MPVNKFNSENDRVVITVETNDDKEDNGDNEVVVSVSLYKYDDRIVSHYKGEDAFSSEVAQALADKLGEAAAEAKPVARWSRQACNVCDRGEVVVWTNNEDVAIGIVAALNAAEEEQA